MAPVLVPRLGISRQTHKFFLLGKALQRTLRRTAIPTGSECFIWDSLECLLNHNHTRAGNRLGVSVRPIQRRSSQMACCDQRLYRGPIASHSYRQFGLSRRKSTFSKNQTADHKEGQTEYLVIVFASPERSEVKRTSACLFTPPLLTRRRPTFFGLPLASSC